MHCLDIESTPRPVSHSRRPPSLSLSVSHSTKFAQTPPRGTGLLARKIRDVVLGSESGAAERRIEK